jgi:hypothetical protein
MVNIIIGDWEIEYDKNKTIEAYNKCQTTVEGCDCQSCQNYYTASNYFENDVKIFFENFGIDIKKPIEIYDNGVMKNNKILYGGFFYIFGKIIKGKDIYRKIDRNHWVLEENNMYKINNDFKIGFRLERSMANDNFPKKNTIQMEMLFWVPCVIEDNNFINRFQ